MKTNRKEKEKNKRRKEKKRREKNSAQNRTQDLKRTGQSFTTTPRGTHRKLC